METTLTNEDRHIATAKLLKLSDREIAEMAGVTHTVVNRIRNRDKRGICGSSTRERVFASIERLKAQRLEALSRLSNGNCVPS